MPSAQTKAALAAAAAAKSLQSCPTLCYPIDGSPRPWDSSGKNTGVGCHFLLQCMKVKTESEVAQLCLALSDPMNCSLPGSSVHGILQARVLEWGAIAFSERQSSEKQNSLSPCLSAPVPPSTPPKALPCPLRSGEGSEGHQIQT